MKFDTKIWNVLIAVSLAAGVMLSPAATAQNATAVSDQEITDAVDNEFLFDQAVQGTEIKTSTVDGTVMLTGTVDSLLEKRRAERLAQTVRGVVSVENELNVEPAIAKSDAEIRQDVEQALLADPAADAYEVSVSVTEGFVTLEGEVESWQEKTLAEKVAISVSGVTGANNDIAIAIAEARTDGEIREDVEAALRWDALVDAALVDVAVNDGVVTLDGSVGSLSEKSRAQTEAWVAGVTDVNASELDVEPWADNDIIATDPQVLMSDSEIEDAVMSNLALDPRVLSFEVSPTVDDAVVTLRGTVDNLTAKRTAARIARTTAGVQRVKNRIRTEASEEQSTVPAETTEERIQSALLRNPYLESFEISAEVIGETAYLDGTVDTFFEKAEADDAAASTAGVNNVVNRIDVGYDTSPYAFDPYVDTWYPEGYSWYTYSPTYTYKTDAAIRDDVNDEMWWSPFVDSDEVAVTVDDGVATLAGTVESWSEYRAATENAYEGGAVYVDNELNVGAK